MAPAVLNVHERTIPASVDVVGRMIDTIGAGGGHGPIRYRVESFERGHRVRFRFLSPEGFVGTHGFDVEDTGAGASKLRPLHDALLEDALDKVEGAFRDVRPPRAWSRRVVFLRWVVRKSGKHRRHK